MGFRAVDKDKNIATGRVAMKVVTHQAAQAVKPFAHIGNSAVNKIPQRATKGQHITLVNNQLKATRQMKLQFGFGFG
jgi:hypothetical protein